VSTKLPCLVGAVFLLSGAAAFAQSVLQVGPSTPAPAVAAPVPAIVGPGGSPGPGGTVIAPGANLSGIQNSPAQALLPHNCGRAASVLSLSTLFPAGAIPGVDTPAIQLNTPIGC
jgi:hypothetical protein